MPKIIFYLRPGGDLCSRGGALSLSNYSTCDADNVQRRTNIQCLGWPPPLTQWSCHFFAQSVFNTLELGRVVVKINDSEWKFDVLRPVGCRIQGVILAVRLVHHEKA